MMENYDRTVELIDTAYNSAGKSSEQFAKYQDTVEYKLKQLTNTWEQLRTGFFSSDTYKDLIDFANKALNLVNDMDWKQILTVATIGLTLGKSIVSNFARILFAAKDCSTIMAAFCTPICSSIAIVDSLVSSVTSFNALEL